MTESKKRMSDEQKRSIKFMLICVLTYLALSICDSLIKPPIDLGAYWVRRLISMTPHFLCLIGAVTHPFIQAYFRKRHDEKIEGLAGTEIEQLKQKNDNIVLWIAGAICVICIGGVVFAVCRRIFKF